MALACSSVSESRMPQRKVYYCQKELLHFIVDILSGWCSSTSAFVCICHRLLQSAIKICVTCLLPPSIVWGVGAFFTILFYLCTTRKGDYAGFVSLTFFVSFSIRELFADETYAWQWLRLLFNFTNYLRGNIEWSAANQQNEVSQALGLLSFSLFSAVPLTLAVWLIESLSMR